MKLSLPSSRNNILKEERRKTERKEEKVGCGEGSFYVEWQRECPRILQVVSESSYQATFDGICEFIVISTAVQYSSFGLYSSLILSDTLMWI